MRKVLIAAAVLAALPAIAQPAKTPFTAVENLTSEKAVRHVTGQQLLAGIRQHALAQFGPMAATVLNEWGVHRCEDFGEIVFNLVENGVLAKTEQDSRADFQGGYDFDEAFRKPFLPGNAEAHKPTAPKTTKA